MKVIGQQNLQNLFFIRIAMALPTPERKISCTVAPTKAPHLNLFKLLDPTQMSVWITLKSPQTTHRSFIWIKKRQVAVRASSGRQPMAASTGCNWPFLQVIQAACYSLSTLPTHKNFGWLIQAARMALKFSRPPTAVVRGATSRAACSTTSLYRRSCILQAQTEASTSPPIKPFITATTKLTLP